MSGQYFAGTPFLTHSLIVLWLLTSWPRSLSALMSEVLPPASEIALSSACCSVVNASIPLILDSFSIFASKTIKKKVYPREMSIHKLIRNGRIRLKMTEEQFAQEVGVTRPAVQQWEKDGGTAPRRANQKAVAKLLGLSVAELMGGDNVGAGPDVRGLVPLISWIQAGEWSSAEDSFRPVGDAEKWLPCIVGHGDKSYALRVRGDSMTAPGGNSRTYPAGCIIFVDPARNSPNNGERVIAKLQGSDEVTFKVYKNEDGRQWLQPLNPSHEPIRDEFNVLGTVIGKWEDE